MGSDKFCIRPTTFMTNYYLQALNYRQHSMAARPVSFSAETTIFGCITKTQRIN